MGQEEAEQPYKRRKSCLEERRSAKFLCKVMTELISEDEQDLGRENEERKVISD